MELRSMRDYSSIYNIKDFINNDLAPKYFDMVDMAQHTVGLYGLMTDTFATVSEDTFNVVSRFITEMLPSKATLPEFIYANAALFGITDTFAKCASMPIYFFIKEADIVNYGKRISDNQTEYRIDSDSIIYVEEVPYSLPHNIVIRTTKYRGQYIHQCTYAIDQYSNSIVGNINPYIKNMKASISGDTFLVLALNVYQYIKVKHHENIISNNKINIPYIDIQFDNGLCNFELLYTDPETKVTTQLIKLVDSSAAIKKPFVYYKLLNENTIRFSFSNDDRFFKPKYNSDLHIHMYETIAEKGNFEWYKGNDIYVNSHSDDVELYYNNEVNYGVSIRGDSKGGRQNLSLDEIKYLTIEKMITVSSYTTDNDLNMHFLNSIKAYETECKFNKIRDDHADRVYGCYTMLKDSVDIFPTNTLNTTVKMSDFDKSFDELGRYIIKPGTQFIYNGESLSDTVITRDEEEHEFIYTSLALMSISKKPNSIAYYINSVDRTVICNYGMMNNSSLHQFIMSDFRIRRNALSGESAYTINMTLTPSNTTNQNVELVPENIKPIIIFETNTGHHIGMVYKGVTEYGGFTFETKLETDDMYTNNMISITNLVDNVDNTTDNRLVKMVDPDMVIHVYYDYGEDENIPHQHGIASVENYTFTNSYYPVEGEMYFAYPLNLSHSNLKFVPNEEAEEGYVIEIENVPLVEYRFLKNLENLKKTLDRVRAQHLFLQETSMHITSNYSINMKFYNTYGRSRLFLLSTGELLNRVNCSIDMEIKFNDGVVVEEYIYSIKRFIKKYIESINGVNTGINQIHISSLITELHNNYPQISYIVFRSINDYPTSIQTIQIKDTSDMVKSTIIPEFLTISENDIMITSL